MATVARNMNIGVEFHEAGLNTISAVLYNEKPQLFSNSQEILIHEETGRKLVLYTTISEPLTFNFYPVNASEIEKNGFFIVGKLEFTLTDTLPDGSGIGLITRIDATIEADLSLGLESSVSEQKIKWFLDGIRFVDLKANHPYLDDSYSPVDRIDMTPVMAGEGSVSAAPAFVALLNYIIEVFLKDGLKKPVEQFPVPPLELVADTGLNVYLRGVQIDNNVLGAYFSQAPGPVIKPAAAPGAAADLSVGVVESTLNDVLKAILPITSPIEKTSANKFLSIRDGSWVRIRRKSYINLSAPNEIFARLFFEARVNVGINIKLGKYWVRPTLPIPIGDPSQILGTMIPYIETTDTEFQVRLRFSRDFFKPAAVVIATRYRDMFRDSVKAWLRGHVSPVLKKIPIIGWIISKGVEVIVGELMAYFAGAYLDWMASYFLTLFATALVNIIRIGWNDKLDFKAFKIKRILEIAEVPVTLKEAAAPRIDGNQGGELILDTWFEDQGLDVPEPPVPTAPTLPDPPPTPGSPTLPTFPDEDFQPVFSLAPPLWEDNAKYRYNLDFEMGGQTVGYLLDVSFARLSGPDRLHLQAVTRDLAGNIVSIRNVYLDPSDGTVLSEDEEDIVDGEESGVEVTTELRYDHESNLIDVVYQIGSLSEERGTFPLPGGARLIPTSLWHFMLMQPLAEDARGVLGRMDVNAGTEYENWTRALPVTVTVQSREEIEFDGDMVETFLIRAVDDENRSQMWVETGGKYRIIRCLHDRPEDDIKMLLSLQTVPDEEI